MPNRRPFSNALKILNGNPSNRPMNPRELKPTPLDASTPPPDEIAGDDVAAAEWRRVIGELLSSGHVTKGERATLTAYCAQYAIWRRALAAVLAGPLLVKFGRHPVANPAIAIANKASVLMKNLAAELGLTPSSRSRVIAVDTPESKTAVDEFTAMQRHRRKR